jgi:signal transduction histidine kinase
VELARTDLGELIRQAVGEYEERLAGSGLEPVVTLPEREVFALADGKYLWRVLDNLLSNVCKYSQRGTRVYIDLDRAGENAVIVIKNISGARLNVDSDELMERFVRGDSARTTEGSGLGLHIARNLLELQRGTFAIHIDGDLFKAEISLVER